MLIIRYQSTTGFLNELLEVSIAHHPLPDLDFALYVSDQPQLRLGAFPPGRAPLVLEYSKVRACEYICGLMKGMAVYWRLGAFPPGRAPLVLEYSKVRALVG